MPIHCKTFSAQILHKLLKMMDSAISKVITRSMLKLTPRTWPNRLLIFRTCTRCIRRTPTRPMISTQPWTTFRWGLSRYSHSKPLRVSHLYPIMVWAKHNLNSRTNSSAPLNSNKINNSANSASSSSVSNLSSSSLASTSPPRHLSAGSSKPSSRHSAAHTSSQISHSSRILSATFSRRLPSPRVFSRMASSTWITSAQVSQTRSQAPTILSLPRVRLSSTIHSGQWARARRASHRLMMGKMLLKA